MRNEVVRLSETIIERVFNSAAFRALAADDEAVIAKRRRDAEARLSGIDESAASLLSASMGKVQILSAEATERFRVFREAQEAARQAMAEHITLSGSIAAQRCEIEQFLVSSADERLDAFLVELREMEDDTRKATSGLEFVNPPDILGRISRTIKTNARGINERLGAIKIARERVSALIRMADQGDVAALISEIRCSIPPLSGIDVEDIELKRPTFAFDSKN